MTQKISFISLLLLVQFQKTQNVQIQIINRFPYSPLCCTPLSTREGTNKQHYGIQFEISNEHCMFFFFPQRERDVLHTLSKSFWDCHVMHSSPQNKTRPPSMIILHNISNPVLPVGPNEGQLDFSSINQMNVAVNADLLFPSEIDSSAIKHPGSPVTPGYNVPTKKEPSSKAEGIFRSCFGIFFFFFIAAFYCGSEF